MKTLINTLKKATHLADRMPERLGEPGDIKIDAEA